MKSKTIHSAKMVFYICLACSIGLMIGGFFMPPKGIIDGSVLTGCGILFLFSALGIFARSLDMNKSASFTKGDVQINVGGDSENNKNKSKK